MEGNSLADAPLDELLDTHRLTKGSITALLREFDMTRAGKGHKVADVESSDIFGVSTWSTHGYRTDGSADQACRIVLKTSKQDAKAEGREINLKSSLLKKCQNIKIRCDMADCGIYVFAHHAYKLMVYVNQERDFGWSSIGNEVLPFFAKNQFKEKLHKMLEEAIKEK